MTDSSYSPLDQNATPTQIEQALSFFLREAGDRVIAFRPAWARALGSIESAILMQQLLHWSGYYQHEWFYRTREMIEAETCLTKRQQEAARKRLVELGLIEEKFADLPRKLYFRIDFSALIVFLSVNSGGPSESNADNNKAQNVPASRNETYQHLNGVNQKQENQSVNPPPPNDESASDDGFATFWQMYPRREARRDAQKAWTSLHLTETDARVIERDIRQRIERRDWELSPERKKYIPYPATYLRREQWLDVPTDDMPVFTTDADYYRHIGVY